MGPYPMVVADGVGACVFVGVCVWTISKTDTGNKSELSAIIHCSQKLARKKRGQYVTVYNMSASEWESRTSLVMMP